MEITRLQPTQLSERIGSLDFLRGIAILGILVINIESFSYPDPWSPFKYGFISEIDRYTRFWVYLLAQGKFFSMFTLLFGVGFYIFLERLEKKGLGLKALDIYSRRLMWLFVIGLLHAYLIWDGDVLYHYAICGFLLFPFRSFRIRHILLVLSIPITVLIYNSYQNTISLQKQYQKYSQSILVKENERTSEDIENIERWQKRTEERKSEDSKVKVPRQNIYQNWKANSEHTKVHKGMIVYEGILLRTLIMMLLGIVLYKSDIFRDYRALKHYWPFTFTILIAALIVNYLRFYHWTFQYFDPVVNIWKGWLFTFPKETLGLAYILLFNGLYQKYLKKIKFKPISLAGRMALTNYIMQSIICTLIFYGFGLGKYNAYSRSELLYFVLSIWIFQLIFSWFWMQRFNYGPLEWTWRKLTYRSFKRNF